MDPSTSNYVYLYGSVVVLVVAYLMWRPKKNPTSRLKLRESQSQNKLDLVEFKNAPEHTRRQERTLNIIFQFNGHNFDVYEVFGLPPGTSLETIENAYKETLATADQDSRPFFDMAYRAARAALKK